MVAALGPGIGKQHEDGARPAPPGKRGEEIVGVGEDEVQVPESGANLLALGARHALRGYVDADARLLRMGRGIGRQKVAVAAPNLPDKRFITRKQLRELDAQLLAPLRDQGFVTLDTLGPQWLRSPPLADSMATISRLMSVGLTPLIRLACPSVRGLIWDSLTALSRRRPDVFI